MPVRRFALVALVASLVVPPAVADDLPPWMQPAPSGPSGASAPEAGTPATAAADADAAAFGEIVGYLLASDVAKKLAGVAPEKKAELIAAIWQSDLKPHQRAQVKFAAEKLRENGSLATQRAVALLILGPPQAIHSEPAREWAGESIERIDDLETFVRRLRGEKAPADAPTVQVAGARPTEVWVYPAESVNEIRVVTFVDDDGDGTHRFVRDQVVPATTRPSTAPGVEVPADLFPPAVVAGELEPLPVLAKGGLPVATRVDFQKATAGRTYTRFTLIVDPSDVDLELGADPKAFAASAEAWLRVEQGGAGVWQGRLTFAEAGAAASEPWMLQLSWPLAPGTYQVTALVADGGKSGGSKTWEVTVPAYGAAVALSTPVAAKAGAEKLPKAAAAEAGGLLPFQIGNYIVRPQPGATFRRGDTVAFVVEVYSGAPVTIEYDLYLEGKLQSSLDPAEVKSFPSVQITQQDLTEAFRDGSYELRITVKNPKNAAESASVAVPFRVRG